MSLKEYQVGMICRWCQGRKKISSWHDDTLELYEKDCPVCDGNGIKEVKKEESDNLCLDSDTSDQVLWQNGNEEDNI